MCTATYLPFGSTGFILTHSRDEKSIRPAARLPNVFHIGEWDVTFPQDPQGKGTWIASGHRTDGTQTTVCLLNGAFTPHHAQPPYKHSRGLVIPHFFSYPSLRNFAESYDFSGIEPFTLLSIEESRLNELRWTGSRLFIQGKDSQQPHIWSSVTLYTPHVIQQRENWFQRWQQQITNWSPRAIQAFHLSAGEGDSENAVRMNRQNNYLTVSLTQVIQKDGQTELQYKDLMQTTQTHQTISPDYATV
ncbi:NRDE family protein [Spirosoma areae]